MRFPAFLVVLVFVLWSGVVCVFAQDLQKNYPPIRSINFQSPISIREAELRAALPFREGQQVSELLLRQGQESLERKRIFESVSFLTAESEGQTDVTIVLSPRQLVSGIEILGVRSLNERALLRLSGLKSGQPFDTLSLELARERVARAYQEEGYTHATVSSGVEELAPGEVSLILTVDEGAPSVISNIEIQGDIPPEATKLRDVVTSYYVGKIAASATVKQVALDLVVGLRREGFLQASAKVKESIFQAEVNGLKLIVAVVAGNPVSITFVGNQALSPEQLLAPLQLETRAVPFSPNALVSLVREIERLYEARGYFYAKATLSPPVHDGNRDEYQIAINEGPMLALREIAFSGNHTATVESLQAVMETKPESIWPIRVWNPRFLQREVLESDLIGLKSFYENLGFLHATVGFDVEQIDETRIRLVLKIDEGTRSEIREVETTVSDAFTAVSEVVVEPLIVQTQLRVGDPFDQSAIEKERGRIENELLERGFPTASVTTEVDPAEGLVRFVAVPGSQVYVDDISISGNVFTREEVIRRELAVAPGDLWNAELVQQSEQGLYRTGLFSNVAIQPVDGVLDSRHESMAVDLTERESGSLDFGVSYNTDEGLHIDSEITQRNLGGRGETLALGIDGFFGAKEDIFQAGQAKAVYTRPHFLYEDIDLVADAFAQQDLQSYDQFSYNRLGGSLFVRRKFANHLRGNLGFNAFSEKVYDADSDVVISDDDLGTTFYSFIRSDLELDLRDDVFNPRRGIRALLEGKFASEALGSSIDLFKVALSTSTYTPVTDFLVWANRIRGVRMVPFGDADVIPLGQRLFLGGRDTLRGFAIGEVGPKGVDGDVLGGDESINASTELQFSLTDNFIAVLFIDAGQAFLENEGDFTGDTLDFSDLRYTPGLGGRYKTPVGPISIEYGFVTERETDERSGRLNIAIGGVL